MNQETTALIIVGILGVLYVIKILIEVKLSSNICKNIKCRYVSWTWQSCNCIHPILYRFYKTINSFTEITILLDYVRARLLKSKWHTNRLGLVRKLRIWWYAYFSSYSIFIFTNNNLLHSYTSRVNPQKRYCICCNCNSWSSSIVISSIGDFKFRRTLIIWKNFNKF